MSKQTSAFILRNYPDDAALKNPEKYSKALAFSPDIIPLYGAKVDQSALVDSATLRGFAGMPIVGGHVNNVYIRGHGSGGPWVASLRVLPSELILWPQVWSGVKPVSSGSVEIPGGDSQGPYASQGPLQFRPPHITGSTHSLVASISADDKPQPTLLADTPDVDSLLSFLSEAKDTTFYNVVVADPTLKHVSATTRLRMYGRAPSLVSFRIGWFDGGASAPDGVEVSLTDDRGKINIQRTPLASLKDCPITLNPSYDGMLTLHIIYNQDKDFDPYSGLSLYVLKGKNVDSVFPPPSDKLLGTLNVLFDPHSTRNLRFANSYATQLRESEHSSAKAKSSNDCGPIPVTKPAGTGWWFRAATNSQNNFPSTVGTGISPGVPSISAEFVDANEGDITDIQFVGTDIASPGLWNTLEDPSVDYAANNKIELVGNQDNYVFVRGHSTISDIDVQSRIFALTGSPLFHPSQWATNAIAGQVFDGSGPINQQRISVASHDQSYLFDKPFNFKSPPDPSPSHYCVVAEARQKRKCSSVYPAWPSDHAEDFATMQDFINWCMSSPLACFRNIQWVSSKPGGDNYLAWSCCTQLVIPDCSSKCSFWTIIVECDSPIIPSGSTWTLTCDDNTIFHDGICFKELHISTESPAYAGCHFTGAPPGYSQRLTLDVNWYDQSNKIPLPSVKITITTTQLVGTSPIGHLTQPPPAGSENWPFYVGSGYPYIGNKPNPSPLPVFQNAGKNAWSFPGTPQFVLGHVAIAAKPE